MRESCLDCTRKHIAQALILLTEARLGYPEYKWLAVGNLAESEAESVKEYPELANKIREERLKIMDDIEVDLVNLIKIASKLEEKHDN